MSRALYIADRIASRLSALTALSGVTVLVDRQKNISAEVAKAVAKASACCVLVLYEGYRNPDASQSGRPVTERTYTVSVIGRPVMAGTTGKLADVVLEIVSQALHNWEPLTDDGFSEIHVTGCSTRPDQKYLVYEIDVEITGILDGLTGYELPPVYDLPSYGVTSHASLTVGTGNASVIFEAIAEGAAGEVISISSAAESVDPATLVALVGNAFAITPGAAATAASVAAAVNAQQDAAASKILVAIIPAGTTGAGAFASPFTATNLAASA